MTNTTTETVSEHLAAVRQDFIVRYAANMQKDCESGRNVYMIPADGWEGLARRMAEGILAGRANISDCAKKAAKAMGAKPTCKGVTDLLRTGLVAPGGAS